MFREILKYYTAKRGKKKNILNQLRIFFIKITDSLMLKEV